MVKGERLKSRWRFCHPTAKQPIILSRTPLCYDEELQQEVIHRCKGNSLTATTSITDSMSQEGLDRKLSTSDKRTPISEGDTMRAGQGNRAQGGNEGSSQLARVLWGECTLSSRRRTEREWRYTYSDDEEGLQESYDDSDADWTPGAPVRSGKKRRNR